MYKSFGSAGLITSGAGRDLDQVGTIACHRHEITVCLIERDVSYFVGEREHSRSGYRRDREQFDAAIAAADNERLPITRKVEHAIRQIVRCDVESLVAGFDVDQQQLAGCSNDRQQVMVNESNVPSARRS